MFAQLDETVDWPSIRFEYGPLPRPRLDFELFGFELGRFGRISADGRALTIPPEYIHVEQVGVQSDPQHGMLCHCKTFVTHETWFQLLQASTRRQSCLTVNRRTF